MPVEERVRSEELPVAHGDYHRPRLLHQRAAFPTSRYETHKHDNIAPTSVENIIDLLTPLLPRSVQVGDSFCEARCAMVSATLNAPIAREDVLGVIEGIDCLEVGRLRCRRLNRSTHDLNILLRHRLLLEA